jgi:ABC-type transport system involved in Fe-S cluster assembly fused permease/ATPase subunit
VDGQDVRDLTLESLRRCIGVVPQDTVCYWFSTGVCGFVRSVV